MADPNKYNALSESGNVYGPIPKNVDSTSNNGRTPVNPIAENPMPFNLTVTENQGKSKGFSGPPEA